MESLTDILRKFIINPIIFVFSNHKKKMLFFISFTCLWLIILFPKSDTKNFIEDTVSSASRGSIDLELEKLSINPFPFGVKLVSPSIRVRQSQTLKKAIKADAITFSPKMSSLLAFKLGGTVYLKNLLGGNGSLSATSLGKNKEKSNKFESSGNIKQLSVQQLIDILGKDLKMPGLADLEFEISGEDSFRKQPSGDFKARFLNVKLPNPLMIPKMGGFEFPKDILWKNSNVFGKLENGKINIKEGTLGTKTSEVNGRFRGNIDFNVNKRGPQVKAQFGRYDLFVELELSKTFEKELGSIIATAMPRVNKRNSPSGTKYLFRVTGKVPQGRYNVSPPKFMPLSSFNIEE